MRWDRVWGDRARGDRGRHHGGTFREARLVATLIVALAPLSVPGTCFAQTSPPDTTQTRTVERHRIAAGPDYMRISKWTALAGGLGTAGYGFLTSLDVDDRYEELELLCASDPVRCGARAPDGSYLDPELERRYRDVLRRNRWAKRTLVAGQAGVLAGAVLFVLELRRRGPPPNIPFEPARLIFEPDGQGGARIGVRMPVAGHGGR